MAFGGICAVLLAAAEQAQQTVATAHEAAGGGANGLFDWRILLVFAIILGSMAIMPRMLRKSREERRKLELQFDHEVDHRLRVKGEADKILLEITEAGREINARLDNKIRVLNKLIKDSDEVLLRLENLQKAGLLPPGTPLPVAGTATRSAVPERKRADSPVSAQTADLSLEASDLAPPKLENAPVQDAPRAERSEQDGSGRWKADMRARIVGYLAEGRTPEEISRLTRLSAAEVSLMLELIQRD